MDVATLAWALLPVAAAHLAVRRRQALLLTLLLVDVGAALLLGRVMLAGATLAAGVPEAAAWGVSATHLGSPEQTDLPLQFHVWWEEVRRLVSAGQPPWVSDRIGGGTALYGHGQTNLPFPLHLPVWVLGAERGTVVMAVWKLVLAGLGMALGMTRCGVGRAAVVCAGVAWAFNLYLLSWLVVPLAWVVAAAGWVIWAVLGTLRGQRGAASLAALVLGILCGWSTHPESAVFLLVAAGVIGTVMAGGRIPRLRRLAAPALLLVAVAGVGTWPTLAAIADSAKLAGSRAEPLYPFAWLTPVVQLPLVGQVLVPWRDGHPADGSWRFAFPAAPFATSAGTVSLLFLLAGGVRRRHRRLASAFGVLAAGAAVLEFQPPLLTPLLAKLPGLAAMTWVRAAYLLPLAITVLGALGLDAWLRRPRPARLALAAGVVQVAVLATVLAPPSRPLHPAARRTALLAGAVAAASPFLHGAGGVLVPLVAAAEAVAQGWEVLPGVRRRASEGDAVQALVSLAAGQEARVVGVGSALPANTAARWGLADLRAHDPVRPRSLARLHAALGAEGADLPGEVTRPWAGLVGAWGVQWLATPPAGVPAAQAASWREVWRGEGGRIYANERYLPIVRLARQALLSPGDPGRGDWEGVDFASTAVVEGVPPHLSGEGQLLVLDQRPHRWRVRVQASGEVLAVLHVPRAAGWRTTLDGQQTPMITANVAAMGVVVPEGEHVVEWRYTPPGLWAGAALSCLGLAGCLWLARGRRRR
mgnify:CR=1 FL=1